MNAYVCVYIYVLVNNVKGTQKRERLTLPHLTDRWKQWQLGMNSYIHLKSGWGNRCSSTAVEKKQKKKMLYDTECSCETQSSLSSGAITHNSLAPWMCQLDDTCWPSTAGYIVQVTRRGRGRSSWSTLHARHQCDHTATRSGGADHLWRHHAT